MPNEQRRIRPPRVQTPWEPLNRYQEEIETNVYDWLRKLSERLSLVETELDEMADQSVLNWGDESYTVKHATISASSSGATEIVSAVPGRRITVVAWNFVVATSVQVSWYSGSTEVFGPQSFTSTGGNEANRMPHGYLTRTESGEALKIYLSSAVSVKGSLSYIEEIP